MHTLPGLTLVSLLAPLLQGVAWASTNMPWEAPLDIVAGSLTGKAGVSAATLGIAWTAINWGRNTEHGKEWFIGTAMGVGGTLGAAKIVQMFGGSAGGSVLVPLPTLPLSVVLSDVAGTLVGVLVYLCWLTAAIAVYRDRKGDRWTAGPAPFTRV